MSDLEQATLAIAPRLAAYVAARRWFRGKGKAMRECTLAAALPLPVAGGDAWLGVVTAAYADGTREDYVLPFRAVDRERARALRARMPHAFLAERADGGALVDALADADVLRALLRAIAGGATVAQGRCVLRFRHLGRELAGDDAEPRPITGEQSNTSIVFGDRHVLKLVRKLDEGTSADLEMGEFLTQAGYEHAPAVEGAIDLARAGGPPATVGVLHRFVHNQGDAWSFFLARLEARLSGAPAGDDEARLRRLGARVASMHRALTSRPDLPSFAAERIDDGERARIAGAIRASFRAALATLAEKRAAMPSDVAPLVTTVERGAPVLEARLRPFERGDVAAWKTRVHGDLHLGQILVVGDDVALIDFEGEPARPLAERRAKRSPFVDVAGVVRSLDYASVSAARAARGNGRDEASIQRAASAWHGAARAAFLDGYFGGVRGAAFLPASDADTRALLDVYLLEKCLYEVHYEMNNRPDWLAIPMRGLAALLEEAHAP